MSESYAVYALKYAHCERRSGENFLGGGLKQGVIEGAHLDVLSVDTLKIYEVAKYMTDCRDEFPKEWFESAKLSPAFRPKSRRDRCAAPRDCRTRAVHELRSPPRRAAWSPGPAGSARRGTRDCRF